MTKLDSIFKSRDITLPTEVRIVKAMVFPVVMYGCESRTMNKAECQRIDDFKLWCRRRLLRVPWTARRSNQSILKKINPKYSLEALLLKLEYFGRLMCSEFHLSVYILWILTTVLCAQSLSPVRLIATPLSVACQSPLSMGFSRQEHWSGMPFPSPMHESEK